MVLPMRTTTAPSACFASLPVSIEIVLPSFRENDFSIPNFVMFSFKVCVLNGQKKAIQNNLELPF
jgi:hypothetical protein